MLKNLLILSLVGSVVLVFAYLGRNKIRNVYYLRYFQEGVYSSANHQKDLQYQLFTPAKAEGEKMPLVLYLHQFGFNGDDNKQHITSLVGSWVTKGNQRKFPCYVLAPQCPAGIEWVEKGPMPVPFTHYKVDAYPEMPEMTMTVQLIRDMIEAGKVDSARVYVIGFSMGATGSWDILSRNADLFAGAIISSGVSDSSKAKEIKDVPVWAFSGSVDPIAPAALNTNMVNAINKHGGKAKITIFEGADHDTGKLAFNYPGVRAWLFEQRRAE